MELKEWAKGNSPATDWVYLSVFALISYVENRIEMDRQKELEAEHERLLFMTEAQLDDHIRSSGEDPEEVYQRGRAAIQRALLEGSLPCVHCGEPSGFYEETPGSPCCRICAEIGR